MTTGSWYYRLCGALQSSDVIGALSGPVAALPDELRAEVVERVVRLPADIVLWSLRDVAWPAAAIGHRYGLNLLAAEALAVAVIAGAAIATSEGNLAPRLAAAAAENVRTLRPG